MECLKSVFCMLLVFFGCANFIIFAAGDDTPPDCYAKIVLVGNYCCGKTAVQAMLFGDPFDPNQGSSDMMNAKTVSKELEDGGKVVQFNIWDTAGADKYYKYVIDFLKGANFVIIVHDLSAQYTENTEKYMNKLIVDVQKKINKDGKIIIVGSKYDRRKENPLNFCKHKALIEGLAKAIDCRAFYSSAKDKVMAPQIRAQLLSYIKEKCGTMELYNENPDKNLFKRFPPDRPFSIRLCSIL